MIKDYLTIINFKLLMNSYSFFILLLSIVLTGCEKESDSTIEKIEFRELTQNPEKYHNKVISVTGFFSYGFEEGSLHQARKQLRKKDDLSAIWLDFSYNDFEDQILLDQKLAKKDKKKIVVKGVFLNEKSGHLSKYFFRIENSLLIE